MITQTSQTRQNGNPSATFDRFGAPEIHTAVEQAQKIAASFTTNQIETMRPTLIVGLGGTGQLVILFLKMLLEQRFGSLWRGKIILLVFDTTPEPLSHQFGEQLITLEPETEFIHIGNVPVGRLLSRIDRQPAIYKRLENALDRIPSVVLRDGAQQDRVLGLLSFYWRYSRIRARLERAVWRLAGRDMAGADLANQQQGINVILLCSLTGGTGSGIFLDTAYLLRSLFEELGDQHEFCYLTGVVVLPQAFRGIPGGHLRANAAAALEELMHVMGTQGGFRAEYPDGRIIDMREPPFNLLITLDGVDERGHTWSNLQAVTRMAADGIFIQAASQIGQRNKNDFDNLQSVLTQVSEDGLPTCLASFGIGEMIFPAPQVADLMALWLIRDVITAQWLAPSNKKAVPIDALNPQQTAVSSRLQTVTNAHMLPLLRRDNDNERLVQIDLPLPTWLLNASTETIAAEAAQHVQAYGRVRVQEEMLNILNRNSRHLVKAELVAWESWVNQAAFAPESSPQQIITILQDAQEILQTWAADGRRNLAELTQSEERQATALIQQESAVSATAAGIPFGRKGRVRKGLVTYFQIAQGLYENWLEQGELRACLHVWGELSKTLEVQISTLQTLVNRLEITAERCAKKAASLAESLQKNDVARISLAEETLMQRLYARYAPQQLHLLALPGISAAPSLHPNSGVVTPLQLAELSTADLGQRLLQAVNAIFAPVRALSIEDVLRAPESSMTPAARRRQLQNLATPAWSIDRTQLPNGGANLVKLVVIGVPDAADSCLGDDNNFVSTRDPQRIVAYTLAAGAPISALQHFASYQQELLQAKKYRPMYILPEFLTGFNQGPLAFALGTIFGLIHNQGTYFYYQPADPLARQVKMGNGLTNAIQTLNNQEDLALEIMERVEASIAQMGLQQAIEVLTTYYTAVPTEGTALAETTRELKRLVRDYAAELRQIDELQHLQSVRRN